MSKTAPTAPTILYLDDHLAVVHKPSGLAVHRGWDRSGTYALQLTRDLLGKWVFPVHRLDRPTSGVLVFALSPEIAEEMQAQFRDGTVEKTYLALVRGIPPESGTIDHPIPSGAKSERVEAVTDYVRLGIFERYALVEVHPRTGRLHQIRRHMKHRSWHVIGDVRYGKGEHNRLFRERFDLHRLALHASSLGFRHPVNRTGFLVRAPVPEDFAGPLRSMGFGDLLDAEDQISDQEP